MTPVLRFIARCLPLALVASVWFVALRPTSMGGETTYVTIQGASMLPTYRTGDLVLTRRAPVYRTGDIVAYRVPEGDFGEGIIVIHRIIGGSAASGFVIQGDNNEFRDDWRPTPKDMVGKAWIHVPRVGLVLSFLHAPVPLGALSAALAVVLIAFPSKPDGKRPRD